MGERTATPSVVYMPNLILALMASAGIIVGSIGPWATPFAMSRSGMNGDGILTRNRFVAGSQLAGSMADPGRRVVYGRARTQHCWAMCGYQRRRAHHTVLLVGNRFERDER